MWVTLGLGVLKNLLGLAKDLNSGENREKKFHVAMSKNARKALNIAEDYFDIVEENLTKLPEGVRKKLKRLSQKFDDLD